MVYYTTRYTEPKFRNVICYKTCDVCSLKINVMDQTDDTIEFKVGNIFPEADCRKVYWFNICKSCFLTKFLKMLKSLDIEVQENYAEEMYELDIYGIRI